MAEKKVTKKVVKKAPKKVAGKPIKKGNKISFMTKALEHKGAIIIGIGIVVILILFVWWIANCQFNSVKKMTSEHNLKTMLRVGRKHFKGNNLPENIHETKYLSLKEMLDKDMLTLKGNVAKKCDLERSKVSVTKTMDNNFSLAARLHCKDEMSMKDEAILAGDKQKHIDKDCHGKKCK